MYAIINDRNKQYIIKKEYILVDYINKKIGEKITFNNIVSLQNDNISDDFKTQKEISFTIEKQIKKKKVNIIKFKRRKNYIRKKGHRQKYTLLKIISTNKKED